MSELPDHVRRSREDWDRNASGFAIEELVEVRPPDGSTNIFHPNDSLEWAQQWPREEIWKVRRH
jgi:hypothetical protein